MNDRQDKMIRFHALHDSLSYRPSSIWTRSSHAHSFPWLHDAIYISIDSVGAVYSVYHGAHAQQGVRSAVQSAVRRATSDSAASSFSARWFGLPRFSAALLAPACRSCLA